MAPSAPESTRIGEADTLADGTGWARQAPETVTVPGLTIAFHPRLERIGERVPLPGLGSGRSELLSRLAPAFGAPGSPRLRPLEDPYLSRQPIVFGPGPEGGSVRLSVAASPIAVAVNGAGVAGERLILRAEVERGAVIVLARRVVLVLAPIDPLAGGEADAMGLLGSSRAMSRLRQEIRRAADLPVPVLLRGETGSGKELAARALHTSSRRRDRPFLAVNMAAVPASLAAAELFGAARGSFTGADRERVGFFGRARGGTLFLDEIGETPAEVQPLLLRALESGEIQPLGGGAPTAVDVRVIAATDTDLEAAVAAGRLRAPLFHRLAGYEIRLPPLAARRDDIGLLLFSFLNEELAALGAADRLARGEAEAPWLPASLVAALTGFDWPGNVRQLKNVARRLAVLGAGLDQLPPDLGLEALVAAARAEPEARPLPAAPAAAAGAAPERYRDPEEVSEEEMIAALKAQRYRIQPAAEALGLSRTSLYAKIEASPRVRKAADLAVPEIAASLDRHSGDLAAAAAELEVSRRGLLLRMGQLGLSRRR